MYLKEKQYRIAMILLCPVQGPWASSFLKPRYPILRFYAAVTFCLFGFFLFSGKRLCAPPPTFRRRATPLVLLVHIKQKLKCTSVIMHSPSYLSIRRLSLHPFESHSFCRPSFLHFRLLVQNRLMDFRESG